MGRSNSRSHSSRSKSRSQSSSRSRSRSHSRKKRYSSRSRSRTYSRSRSRDRVYSRDYRRDYRNNRGMRRPYGYRGRGRGYYQGGGGRYHRGGYRPVWNRRHSRSPRRGRSRSRSPKRRSVSSQRSRSRSRRSYRSSRSPRSSSSRSSSPYSKSPVSSKRRASLEKQAKKTEGAPLQESPLKNKSQDEQKDTFEHDPSEPLDDFNKSSAASGDIWPGLSAYDNSPRSPHSPSIASPPSQSSSCSDAPLLSTAHSAKDTPQHSHSIQHSPERSGSGSLGNGSSRYSPSQNSPLHHIPSRRSPAKTIPSQSAPREEARVRSFYPEGGEQETAKGGKFMKRYTDEESRVYLLDRGNTREKEAQKERGSEKGRTEGEREWEEQETLDFFIDKETGKEKFNDSEGEDTEETEDYRQFRKSVLADQGKNFPTASHRNAEEEGTKYKSKISIKGSRESDGFRDEKCYKLKETGCVVERPSATKDKHKEEDKSSERLMMKKETQSPEQVKSEKLKELFDYSPPLHKNLDAREKSTFREESPLRIKMIASDSHRPEVKLKMAPVPLDDSNRPASLTKDRLLASTLVHSVKKEQEFRSIFDHIKLPQASKSTSESFIQHIVSLVHHVKEQYFKSPGMTLNERFTAYQKATEEHCTRQKSPEIHRRIDISPSTLRKHTRLTGEERVFKEESQKGDKKLRCDSADLRHDIDRRRKERSKERGDSKGSRESSGSRKQEKTPKDYKDYKSYKDDSKQKRDQDRSRSSPSSSPSSSSSSSREEKDCKKERDEEFKTHHEQKEYSGFAGVNRPRGTFHDDRDDGVDYWAKRGRGRGTFQRGRGRFNFKKSGSSPKWTHDKYQGDGIVEDEEETVENNEEKDRRKEEKE
ncbi:bcl-2-associated transcription factor 1 isoform X2 [Oenanthe melanoleuca]|uniref:bcl-2-associated transcription factor 1 isoform X2 n=1 Tax=Oenanthe melanoleuca TaxID=2939378 RepID=UPI0024C0E8EE|nr:bcl-2-associated transcription factor 1 isoform X2 [Oenanthe melanoleuca]XP_056342659.1 bcl-2-associated transcription factor 1 isoform X2 [Oenanthe melanoleuca]XP_056342660.1 bcl-2-associated transcription factor 1 isoform X2 [Oenanthe melanoleuca]XP_056342661.1 bcl-2-associated transcription factor 1 isoform X2 [Oenanthe melanoleuca]XP_056342662.1 bcl-2-associated transcription factor 1 isoform X2 [Oenanthe melanoleuca]XP_056342663.1 bcl-2-associated transcription factor 1 isoform X2 [Oen